MMFEHIVLLSLNERKEKIGHVISAVLSKKEYENYAFIFLIIYFEHRDVLVVWVKFLVKYIYICINL